MGLHYSNYNISVLIPLNQGLFLNQDKKGGNNINALS